MRNVSVCFAIIAVAAGVVVANSDYAFYAVNFDTILNEINKYFNGLYIYIRHRRSLLKMQCNVILISFDSSFLFHSLGSLLLNAFCKQIQSSPEYESFSFFSRFCSVSARMHLSHSPYASNKSSTWNIYQCASNWMRINKSGIVE